MKLILSLMLIGTVIYGQLNSPEKEGQNSIMMNHIITLKDIDHLPDPVQKHLQYAGVIGTPYITEVELKQTGEFKIDKDKPYSPITAKQTYSVNKPEFEWKAKLKLNPLMTVYGYDRLINGEGLMKMKVLGFIPVMTMRSKELNQGSLVRYLSEMIWFPQGFLAEFISWESVNDNQALATLSSPTMSVTGLFTFDDVGRITNFTSERYYVSKGDMRFAKWSTPIDEYGEMAGLRLPLCGRAVWNFPEGDLEYAKIRVTEIVYR